MYRKRKVTYYELCSSFFEILIFSALRVGLHLMTKCGLSGIINVYNHNNDDDYVITGVEKM